MFTCSFVRLYSYTSFRLYPCKTYQMGSSGLEPPTSRLSGARSNLLSYEPAAAVPQPYSHFFWLGIEVLTRSLAFGLLYFVNIVLPKLSLDRFRFLTSLPCLSGQGDRFSVSLPWWRWWDSNPWPPACRAGALPTELHPHVGYPSSS